MEMLRGTKMLPATLSQTYIPEQRHEAPSAISLALGVGRDTPTSKTILSNTSVSSSCSCMNYRSQRRNGAIEEAIEGAARESASIRCTI